MRKRLLILAALDVLFLSLDKESEMFFAERKFLTQDTTPEIKIDENRAELEQETKAITQEVMRML